MFMHMDNSQEIGMEVSPEKNLTPEEEEKLKEKLALLKKEYKRTFNRLQRSQTQLKKPDEQNRSPSRASARTEPLNTAADSSGKIRESQQCFQTPREDGDRRLSFRSNVESEILCAGTGSPQCPDGPENGIIEHSQEPRPYNRGQILRSRLKLKRSRRRECSVESSPTNTLTFLDRSQHDVSALCASGSPLFKKSINGRVGDAQLCRNECDRSQSFSLIGQQERSSTKDITENHHRIQQNSLGLKETACSLMNSSDISVVSRACDTSPSVLGTPEMCKRKTTDASSESSLEKPPPNTNEGQRKPSVIEENSPLTSCTLVEGLLFPVEYYVRTTRRMSSCQRKVDLDAVINSQLGRGRRGTRGRGKQEKVTRELDSAFQSLSPNSFLASGSVTSTTSLTPRGHPTAGKSRGTSRCRRGKGRGGRGAVNTSLAEMSPGAKEVSVQLEFNNVASPPTSGSQSEKENCEAQSQSQIDSAVEPGCPITGAEKPRNNERMNSQASQIISLSGRNGYSLRPRNSPSFSADPQKDDSERGLFNHMPLKQHIECSGSLFPSLSNRLSLKHLSSSSDIRDFHLPDEEFGDLKLQKLKTASHPEPSVPEQLKSQRRGRCDGKNSTAVPPAGGSTILQGAEAACSDGSKLDLGLLKTSEELLSDMESAARKQLLASPKDGPVLSQLYPTPEYPKALTHESDTQLTPRQALSPEVCENGREQDFPLNRSCEEARRDGADYSRVYEGVGTVFLKPTTITQVLDGPLVFDACSPSDTYSSAVDELETHGEPHSKSELSVEILPVDQSMEPVDASRLEMSSKKLTCDVLFSTSMCSVPLETFEETEVATCTPGLPLLGSSPAFAPASPCRGSPLTCRRPKLQSQTVIGSQTLPAGVTGAEPALVKSDGIDLTQCNVTRTCNGTVNFSGAEPQECEKTKHGEACNTQSAGYPVSDIDGNSSQVAAAGGPVPEKIEEKTLKRGRLHLVSQIQDGCRGRCAVDLSLVWWEFPDCRDLCIVAASESSVSLWRPRDNDRWEAAHTWDFTEVPVIQILPLPGEKNIVCVALGNLEIREIWSLLCRPGSLMWEQQMVTRGHAKIAQGLTTNRIVSSSGVGSSQVVEVLQLSAKGSAEGSHRLISPQDTVLAFCEVDGERNALVGSTVDNKIVIWNLDTKQLLRTIYVGDLCQDSTCLSASSDSGLLFLVFAGLHNASQKATRTCIFRLIAVNPKGARCANVMHYTLPDDHSGRFLEGDVKNRSAAAVLSCGSIALWDLSRSRCSAMLPPAPDAPWSLVRWDQSSSSILAGQKDGNICIYSCTGL
ncbi:partner and localizer of BRCA2 [Spea bombifrons]|uniref:partner and localizer of BRCA2 n=1 Tax=Spea bombifrons TaxID=233779 RepID=UPI00234A6AF5|nr:partner and localizer of BRCA2 [Spea bombifrons]